MDVIKFNDVAFEKNDGLVGVRQYLAHTAIITINGRYPLAGDSEVCQGETRIIGMSGKGDIISGNTTSAFQTDDVAVIAAGEAYYFDNCESLKVAYVAIPPQKSSDI